MKNNTALFTKVSRITALCALFLVPLVFLLEANESFETPKGLAFYLFTSASAGFFLIPVFFGSAVRIRLSPLSLPVTGIFIVYLLSLIKAGTININSFPLNFQFFMLIAFSALLFLLLTSLFTRKDSTLIIVTVLFSHALTALYGLMQYMGVDFISWVSFGEGRVYSTLGNPDYMAAQYTLLLPLSAALLMLSGSLARRLLWAALSLAFIFLIIVSHGRGAWLAMAASFIIFPASLFLIKGKETIQRYRKPFLAAAGFLFLLIIIFTVPNPLNRNSIIDRLKQGFDRTSDSVAVRLFYWESALQMAETNPFFGVGPGGFSLNTSLYQRRVLDRWERTAPDMAEKVQPHVELYAHNDILQNMAETGLFGLGVFLWFIISLIRFGLKRSETGNGDSGLIRAAIITSVSAFVINGLLNFPWRVMPTITLLFTITAVLAMLNSSRSVTLNMTAAKSLSVIFVILAVFVPVTQARSLYANICIKNGQALFAQKNFEAARVTFDKALASGPRGTDKIELLLYAGNAYHALGNAQKGIDYYLEGIKMFPNFIESHYNVANIYMQTGQIEKAIAEFNKVLALNPKFSAAHNNLANIYFNSGNFDKAREMYELAVKSNPKSVEARYNLGAALFRDKKYKEAKVQLMEALKVDPNYELAKQWAAQLTKMGY